MSPRFMIPGLELSNMFMHTYFSKFARRIGTEVSQHFINIISLYSSYLVSLQICIRLRSVSLNNRYFYRDIVKIHANDEEDG